MRSSPRIAVVGGGVTGLVAARTLARGGARVVLLEATERVGGKVRTDELEGRIAEAGPDSFVAREPDAEDLCRDLGLGPELIEPSEFGAHIWSRGRLRRPPEGSILGLPPSSLAAARAGLLSPAGALRSLGDLVLPGPLSGPDVSVGSLIRRRLGDEVLERLVGPILGGTRAGRVDEMSLAAAAPQIDSIARTHRSLMRGARATRRGGGAGPPRFLGLMGGMSRLVERLEREVSAGAEVRLRSPVQGIDNVGAEYRVHVGTGAIDVEGLVVATPADKAARLLASVAPRAAAELRAIDYASVALVHLVYPSDAGTLPDGGSGVLVPSSEERVVTGCTWTTRKWPHLSTPDGALRLRCFVGRDRRAPALALSDADLAAAADREMREVLGLSLPARSRKVVRWDDALPQYTVGHRDRVARIDEALSAAPEVRVAGAALRGSGLTDCVRQGQEAAEQVLRAVAVRV